MSVDRIIDELEKLRLAFDNASARRRLVLFRQLISTKWTDATAITRAHELALFAVAYPNDEQELAAAQRMLRSISDSIRSAAASSKPPAWLAALDDSGIAHTATTAAFSIDLADWLTRRFPDAVELDWQDGDVGNDLCEFLPAIAASVEQDGLLDDRLSLRAWFDIVMGRTNAGGRISGRALGRMSHAAYLFQTLKRQLPSGRLLDRIFDSLDIRLRIQLADPIASRTFARFPARPTFFQRRTPLGSFDVAELLAKPLPHRRTLPMREATALLDVCRATLAVRQRETDPITYANPREGWLFQLERGVDVAIFGMTPDRRLPIESFFGYVAARNGVPIAYGGGWVFLDRCEVGVNLFDTFRGGESAFVFTQILRVYRGLFGAKRLTVDPFQFGAGNPEAIQSGAFWFYHRLGFRPTDARLAKLAAAEHVKTRADRSYRSTAATLRRLAKSPLELTFVDSNQPARPDIALGNLSLAVTEMIGRRFKGDTAAATHWAMTRMSSMLGISAKQRLARSPDEQRAFENLSLLTVLIRDLPNWPASDKQSLADAMFAKGGPREKVFADAVRTHKRLYHALMEIALGGRAIIAALDKSTSGPATGP